MEKERLIGESRIDVIPEKPLIFTLKEGSVTTPKLSDGAVTPEKLSEDVPGAIVAPLTNQLDAKYKNITEELYSMIASLQVGGIALSGQFGDKTDIGIHQKALTKAIGRLWDELATLTGKIYMDFILTAQPSVVYSGTAVLVTITADSTDSVSDFDSIEIYVNDELKAESSDINVFSTVCTINTTSEIKAVGVIMGKEITKKITVINQMPFFMGSGAVYTDIINEECRQILDGTLEGDYDITVKNTGENIFIIIPISKKDEFRRADMNGYEIPFAAPSVMQDYVVYKSLNTYQAGTYNIDIDINS